MLLMRTRPLVNALAKGEISAEQRAYYLLASFLVFNLAYYSGFVASGTVPWTPPYIAEALAVILINIVGIVATFDASGGKSNKQYIIDFTCLYVPVTVTTLLAFWGVYWVLRIGFHEAIIAVAQSNMQFAINMTTLGFDGFSMLAFAATIGSLVVTYVRLTKLLALVRAERGEA
ncbi:conserved membrane hypothetical protein [Rubrivivax sp. A210]|uniref:hypothetical protein n=1 Tax=Rubrivivax sp. A210 TaxID=2772301 RepID=UPI001918CED7|nr:hypothetical protein [Rubrivivax sp. A210]CAD5374027.1 conserved membrane hypothetical protein [Rubrivivax sp. A210]